MNPARAPNGRQWSRNVVRRILPNGLTVLIERIESAPVVAVVAHVRAGYFDEPDELVGISHVLEHMFFKGTPRFGPGQLASEIHRLGGYTNAGTIYDKTIYYALAPSGPGVVSRLVEIQADAVASLSIDPGELDRELEVVIQEAKRKLDNPSAVVTETLYAKLFANHRIKRWRIGTPEGLRLLTSETVHRYYATRYTPGRIIVAIVGDLDPNAAWESAEQYYGSLDRLEANIPPSPPETAPPPSSATVLRGDVRRAIATLGWRTVGSDHPDTPALDIGAMVLGSGRGSWLTRGVRNTGLASSAHARHYTTSDVGVFDIFLEGDTRLLDEACNRSLESVAALAHAPAPLDDVRRAVALTNVRWSRRMEMMDTRAASFCEFEALGKVALIDTWHDSLNDVSPDHIRAAFERYMAPDTVAAVAYLQPDAESVFAEERLSGGIAEFRPDGIVTNTVRSLSGSWQPHITRYDRVSVAGFPGGDLLVCPKTGTEHVYLGLFALGLREEEAEHTAGMTTLLLRVALRGAGEHSAEQLAFAAEQFGGAIEASVFQGAAGWGVTVRPDSIGPAIRLLWSVATEAWLSDDDVRIERDLLASDAARAEDDMVSHPLRRVLRCAMPTAPYGLPALGIPATVCEFTTKDVHDWAARFRARRVVVLAVGDTSVDRIVNATSMFQQWSASDATIAVETPWVSGAHQRETRSKKQTALAMAFPAGAYTSANRIPLIVMSYILGGMSGRLFRRLRDERSLAYTVLATPWFRAQVGAVLTYIAMSPERETEARDAMLEELQTLARDEIDANEMERARWQAVGAVQLKLQSGHSMAADMLTARIHDDLAGMSSLVDRLRAVTASDVHDVADRVFQATRRAEFVLEGAGADD